MDCRRVLELTVRAISAPLWSATTRLPDGSVIIVAVRSYVCPAAAWGPPHGKGGAASAAKQRHRFRTRKPAPFLVVSPGSRSARARLASRSLASAARRRRGSRRRRCRRCRYRRRRRRRRAPTRSRPARRCRSATGRTRAPRWCTGRWSGPPTPAAQPAHRKQGRCGCFERRRQALGFRARKPALLLPHQIETNGREQADKSTKINTHEGVPTFPLLH